LPQIDYFLSTVSPFTYLAGDRLEIIAARHGATICYKPFDVVANFSRTGGTKPSERHESRKAYRLQELARIAKRQGLPINLGPAHWPTNPAPSSYAIIAAQNAGGGDLGALVQGFLSACWAGEKDIADDAVVKDCLAAAGFDPSLADQGLIVGAETFASNNEEAARRGVFGAPSYLIGDEVFWGQDRLSYLDEYLADRA
jgi:2-hydroxychromene-2-carboxylate isomerase